MVPVAHWTTRYGSLIVSSTTPVLPLSSSSLADHLRSPHRAASVGQRGLVEDIGGQAHMGRVDQLAVPTDGPDAIGLGAAVGGDGLAGFGYLPVRGGEDLVGHGDLARMDGPLSVEAQQAGVHRRPPVPLQVPVGRVGSVDGIDT